MSLNHSFRPPITLQKRQAPVVPHPEYRDHFDKSDHWVQQRRLELYADAETSPGICQTKFPVLLYRMLEDIDATDLSLIVRWLPHGRAFVVMDKALFVSKVLPLYFPMQTKFTSFRRQLNVYGFRRLRHAKGGYYHELFLRGRPDMASIIPRPPRSQQSARQTYDASTEPNFAAMKWLPDVAHSFNAVGDIATRGPWHENHGHAGAMSLSHLNHSMPLSCSMFRPTRDRKSKLAFSVRRSNRCDTATGSSSFVVDALCGVTPEEDDVDASSVGTQETDEWLEFLRCVDLDIDGNGPSRV